MPLVHRRQFWCETCNPVGGETPGDAMTGHQLIEHLKQTHGLKMPITGKKQGICCLDGPGREYHNTYHWTFPGNVKVTECASGERTK